MAGLTKRDVMVVLGCVFFLMMSLGAVGSRGRHRAKDILCRSNLHKLYLCAFMFTEDNDDSFWRGWLGTAAESIWWFAALQPYYGDADKLRCCPAATKTEWALDGSPGPGFDAQPYMAWGYDSWLDPHDVFDEPPYGSYGANGWLEDKPSSSQFNSYKYWRYLSAVTTPSQVPFMLDAQWVEAWPEPHDRPPATEDMHWQDQQDSHFVRVLQNRHNESENCVFMDGTARRIGLKELWVLKWHKEYNTSGPWTLAGGVTRDRWETYASWMADFTNY